MGRGSHILEDALIWQLHTVVEIASVRIHLHHRHYLNEAVVGVAALIVSQRGSTQVEVCTWLEVNGRVQSALALSTEQRRRQLEVVQHVEDVRSLLHIGIPTADLIA